MFENLTAWQMLLWIVGLEIISAPIIVTVANSIINAKYKARELHAARMAKAVGGVLEKIGNDVNSKLPDILKAKTETENKENQNG